MNSFPLTALKAPWEPAAAAKSLQSCPTLCDPIGGSPPSSAIPGILQARTLEWVAISFYNAWKWKVKVKSLSHVRLFATPWTAAYQAPPPMGFPRQEYWSGVPLSSPLRTWASSYFCFVLFISVGFGALGEKPTPTCKYKCFCWYPWCLEWTSVFEELLAKGNKEISKSHLSFCPVPAWKEKVGNEGESPSGNDGFESVSTHAGVHLVTTVPDFPQQSRGNNEKTPAWSLGLITESEITCLLELS